MSKVGVTVSIDEKVLKRSREIADLVPLSRYVQRLLELEIQRSEDIPSRVSDHVDIRKRQMPISAQTKGAPTIMASRHSDECLQAQERFRDEENGRKEARRI